MDLQMDVATLPPAWARRYGDAFPTYVGTRPAPTPPPRAPMDGELLDVDEALTILELLLERRRAAAEPPTVVVAPAKAPLAGWSELLEADDDEEAVDLDLFCASFAAPARELATA